jgi:hypothetical protein
MKKLPILPILISFLIITACEKNKDDNQPKVTFYTNAQAIFNCGSFDVEVYVDSTLVGVLKEPYLPLNSAPECSTGSGETVLTINKPEGEYDFFAKFSCSTITLNYSGSFRVKKDSCSLVFIDLTYNE